MVATIAFSADDLKRYAAKAGLGLQFVVKEAFLFELSELFAQGPFVLKGGTAINKGYLQSRQRFSEDLDYDADISKKELASFVGSLNWKIKKQFFTKHTVGFLFAYSFNGVQDAVKTEVSFGIKGKHEKTKLTSDFLPVSKLAEAYSFKELNAQKERAIIDRKEWKDLYDLYWMSQTRPEEFKITDKATFKEAVENLQVPKAANAYIPVGKRPNWDEVKEKMQEFTK